MTLPRDKMGIPTPVFKPAVRAAADRGKLGSSVTFSTQAGCFDFQTRPGSPTPDLKCDCFRDALKGFSSPSPQYHACNEIKNTGIWVWHPRLAQHPACLLANFAKHNFQRRSQVAGRCDFHRDRLEKAELLLALLWSVLWQQDSSSG